ncbi:hypothetical protein HDV06_005620 [Boothiomyces sp. JEL0866]|nr:hypothetical protein HDV06_005620 [Boothiomyces sp. JEL0866]
MKNSNQSISSKFHESAQFQSSSKQIENQDIQEFLSQSSILETRITSKKIKDKPALQISAVNVDNLYSLEEASYQILDTIGSRSEYKWDMEEKKEEKEINELYENAKRRLGNILKQINRDK